MGPNNKMEGTRVPGQQRGAELPSKPQLLILGLLRMKGINAYFHKATLSGDLYYYSLAFSVILEKLVLEVGRNHHKIRKDVILAWKAGNLQ